MEKSLDYKGRWRNHTVAFRVSDEEAKLLNDLVALSGLEYSCAVKPHIRTGGNRQSGIQETVIASLLA